jgi:hypothetical protein
VINMSLSGVCHLKIKSRRYMLFGYFNFSEAESWIEGDVNAIQTIRRLKTLMCGEQVVVQLADGQIVIMPCVLDTDVQSSERDGQIRLRWRGTYVGIV